MHEEELGSLDREFLTVMPKIMGRYAAKVSELAVRSFIEIANAYLFRRHTPMGHLFWDIVRNRGVADNSNERQEIYGLVQRKWGSEQKAYHHIPTSRQIRVSYGLSGAMIEAGRIDPEGDGFAFSGFPQTFYALKFDDMGRVTKAASHPSAFNIFLDSMVEQVPDRPTTHVSGAVHVKGRGGPDEA